MQSVISPSFNVRRIRSVASMLLCFAILFAVEAPTVFACTSTSLDVYYDSSYVYADAQMFSSGCLPCYADIDLTLTSPTSRSAETLVNNDPGSYARADVSLPISGEYGTWTANAYYNSDDLYQRTQNVMVCGFNISPGSATNSYRTNPVQQDLPFSANILPSLTQCHVYNFNPNETLSCSTTVADGDINMANPANSCSTNGNTAITGHAYYFGPGVGSGYTGHLTLGFRLDFGSGNVVDKSSTIQVLAQ